MRGARRGKACCAERRVAGGTLAPPFGPALLSKAPLSGARLALVRAPDHRRDLLVGGQSELIGLEPANFIAQAPCFFKLEVCSSIAHLLFELGDVGAQIVADHMIGPVVAKLDGDAVL